ncbi:MAG: hypothetical protein J6V48_09655, partial [Clostridia bacterium]|nr:hypothetical protein [Clostridia bacterium]
PRRFCPFDSNNQALEWQKPQFSSRICGILSADSAGVLKKSDFFNTPFFSLLAGHDRTAVREKCKPIWDFIKNPLDKQDTS